MSTPVHAVRDDDSLWDTWDLMSRNNLRHAVVVDARDVVVGVVDDRRVLHMWPTGPVAAQRTPVRSLLKTRVRKVTEGAALHRVARAMLANDVDAVAVVSSTGKAVGLVTATDLVAHLAQSSKPARRPHSRNEPR
jgi:CBS domain-containing protein